MPGSRRIGPSPGVRVKRSILITGATGFAGSFLVERYVRAGWDVHGTCHGPVNDLTWLPPDLAVHFVDLTDRDTTDTLIAEVRPPVVAHLAAQSSVTESLSDPMRTFTDNTRMQLNLLEAVSTHVPEARVLVIGSCDEYGYVTPDENPVDEQQELRPLTPYALSKVAQDLMGYQYYKSRGLNVIRVRPFVQVGPRRSDQFVAGSFARQVAEIEARKSAPIIEVGNVDLQRDITDVRDTVEAYALLIEKGQPGAVYNVGTGESSSLRELLMATMRAAGVEAEIRQNPVLRRTGEPPVLVSDSSRTRALTGWAPRISLQQSAADTLDYWRGRIETQARSAR